MRAAKQIVIMISTAAIPATSAANAEDISLKRTGAGIDQSLVDIQSFLEMGEEKVGFLIEEPTPLFEILKKRNPLACWRIHSHQQ